MATYYVKPTGSNGAAGTSTGTAWATITYALGATSGFASGDTLWVAAGVYREVCTVGMTSPTATTYIKGDTDGAIFGTAGECRITGFTTNDDSTGSASAAMAVTSKNYLYFQNLKFEGAAGSGFTSASSTNLTLDRCMCTTTGSSHGIRIDISANVTANHLVKNCFVIGRSNVFQIVGNAPSSGNQDMGMTIENCFVVTSIGNCIFFTTGSGTGTLSGIKVTNCTTLGGTGGIFINTALYRSSTASVTVRNCLLLAHTNSLVANVSGQMDEDYCRLVTYSTSRTLVTNTGGNDITGGVYGLDFTGGFITGAARNLFLMPNISGVVSGDGTATGAPAIDIYGYTRPSPPSVGAAEANPLPTASGGTTTEPRVGLNAGLN